MREVLSAGEPCNPEVIEQVRAAWGLTIREGYGQTETTLQIGYFPGQTIKPGAMGQPAPGYRVRLLDENGREQDEAEVCLALDPPPLGLMQGYQGDDGAVVPLSGAVYRTGDIAMRDADGHFTYVGRADDVFKASDYRISPFELESALIEHPAVAEAAVVPSPDPVRLAVPKAFVALAPGHNAPDRDTALAIFRHLRAHLAPFKRVRRLEFAELPKTISGKIRRVELRGAERQNRAEGGRARTARILGRGFSRAALSSQPGGLASRGRGGLRGVCFHPGPASPEPRLFPAEIQREHDDAGLERLPRQERCASIAASEPWTTLMLNAEHGGTEDAQARSRC